MAFERKVVQLVSNYSDESGDFFAVVCEDGTMWHKNSTDKWIRLEGPPANTEVPGVNYHVEGTEG
jgi:hypothetical protein